MGIGGWYGVAWLKKKACVGDRKQWQKCMYTNEFLTGSTCQVRMEDLDVLD